MSGLELKPMKIHTQKGKRRLWLEQQRYGLDGFVPGSNFKVTYHADSIEIESDPEGSNKVFTRVKKPSKLHPTERQFAIVSLHNSKLKAIFGDTEDGVDTFCRYEQKPGYLKIWPADKVEQFAEKLAEGIERQSKEVPVIPDYSNEETYAEVA
jgi:hypothetical protein